ncbi:putative reverse transcriptase domain, viral movement protein [Tanacetum coccineum]
MAEPENAESTVQFDSEDYEEHQENPNQETPTKFPKSDIKQYFTFDDIPPSKWHERSIEMLTWCTAELQYYTINVVIKRFLTRLQGRLRDWYHSVGEYRQIQIQQLISPKAFMSIIYSEFISSPWEHTTHAREEFLKMKLDDVNLKKVFLNSFPESLGNVAYRALEARYVHNMPKTLGELYSYSYALANFATRKSSLLNRKETGNALGTACDGTNTADKIKPWFFCEAAKKWKFIERKSNDAETLTDVSPVTQSCATIAYSDFSSIMILTQISLERGVVEGVGSLILGGPHDQPNTDVLPIQEELHHCHSKSSPPYGAYAKPFRLLHPLILVPQSHFKSNISQITIGSSPPEFSLPLNHFLADDKFPLRQKKSLFQHLADVKVLSKFDLKSRFWQLGIKPEDRLKTAFCIPDHHYQWKVMSFGLKNAPSAFQKAMITIFEPILANTLVYIDDILLFSPDEQFHAELLSKFYSLVTKYGIMLSEKKMEVRGTTIQFLGMEIFDGKYQPQPHVAQELLKFPDELSSQKMIQQFLGLVNYMADFLPKLSHHTALLFPMLKKNPPQWTSRQIEAVKAIKCLAEKMPPLKISASAEKRILQTDASDKCWGAVLLVQDNNNKRHVCGYKSGTFKASEQHYV